MKKVLLVSIFLLLQLSASAFDGLVKFNSPSLYGGSVIFAKGSNLGMAKNTSSFGEILYFAIDCCGNGLALTEFEAQCSYLQYQGISGDSIVLSYTYYPVKTEKNDTKDEQGFIGTIKRLLEFQGYSNQDLSKFKLTESLLVSASMFCERGKPVPARNLRTQTIKNLVYYIPKKYQNDVKIPELPVTLSFKQDDSSGKLLVTIVK